MKNLALLIALLFILAACAPAVENPTATVTWVATQAASPDIYSIPTEEPTIR